MSEYASARANPYLIGRHARIKKIRDYSAKLWNVTGTITEVLGCLFLEFDSKDALKNRGMYNLERGVYLTLDAFELI